MVQLQSLWIGDEVQVISSEEIGTFEGIKNGHALIKINGQTKEYHAEQLQKYIAPKQWDLGLDFDDHIPAVGPKKSSTKWHSEIDLHIEKLKPDFIPSQKETVLDFQLKSCESFVRHAIENRMTKCTIIHGKGDGTLRTLVNQMLSAYQEVNMQIHTNQNGATEVWLNYR